MNKTMDRNRFSARILLGVMTIILMAGCGGDEQTVTEPASIAFVTDYNQALSTASEKNQPMLIDFYTDWCTWCKTLDTVTYVDSAVIAKSHEIVFVKIDAEVDTAIRNQYRIQGYPTIILAASDGTEIDRIGGYLPPADFLETVDNYLNGVGTLDYYLNLPDSEVTTETLFAIADKYADRGMSEEADDYYNRVVKADPDNNDGFTDQAMIAIGNILRRNEKYDDALTQFASVMKKFKDAEAGQDALIWTAICYRQKGDTVKAIAHFEDFLKKYPESADTAYAKAQIERLNNPPPPEEEG